MTKSVERNLVIGLDVGTSKVVATVTLFRLLPILVDLVVNDGVGCSSSDEPIGLDLKS